MTTKRDAERRLDEIETDVDDAKPLKLTHLIGGDEGHGFEPVDLDRGIWYSTLTDDLRLGPTEEELEDSDGFLDALITDEGET
jgi:hypothetical protein